MSGEYYNLLLKRSKAFLRNAHRLLEEGEYDLAAFSAEQAAQLRVGAMLYRLWGVTPRIHSIRGLLGIARDWLLRAGLRREAERIEALASSKRSLLAALEEAYTISRYGHTAYTEEAARELIAAAEEVISVVEEVERAAADVGEDSDRED